MAYRQNSLKEPFWTEANQDTSRWAPVRTWPTGFRKDAETNHKKGYHPKSSRQVGIISSLWVKPTKQKYMIKMSTHLHDKKKATERTVRCFGRSEKGRRPMWESRWAFLQKHWWKLDSERDRKSTTRNCGFQFAVRLKKWDLVCSSLDEK